MKAREKRRKRAARLARQAPAVRLMRSYRLGFKHVLRVRFGAWMYACPKVRAKAIHAVTPRMP